jgi:hypothetical protein
MGVMFWVWGAGPKTSLARDEAERIAGAPSGTLDQMWRDYRAGVTDVLPISDLAPGAVTRLRQLVRSAPAASYFFGAPSIQQMAGGLVIRARERGVLVDKLVFEDHGIAGPGNPNEVLLFMGGDALTLRTLPQHRRSLEQMRLVLTPGAEIFFVHCEAAADDCRLARALSRVFERPVYVADAIQDVGNQAIEGNAFRVEGDSVTPVPSFPRAVLHFD